jgi:hypothetical protein
MALFLQRWLKIQGIDRDPGKKRSSQGETGDIPDLFL